MRMSGKLSGCFRQVLQAQLGLLMAGALVAGLVFSLDHALAAAFGSGLAIFNTILARRSVQRASELAYTQPDVVMLPVFSGLVQRLLVFAAGFAGGVLLLSLLPLPLLAGFALAQAGYLACRGI
jgi:hypothetical protein